MSGPSATVRQVARYVLAHAAGLPDDSEAAPGVDAAERALEALRQPLSRLVGADGYGALVARARHLAAREPVRAAAHRDGDGDGDGGDDEPAARDGTHEGNEGARVLEHVIFLLVTFIGSSLTTRTLRGVWPEVPDVLEATDPDDDHKTPGGAHRAAGEERAQ